MLIYTNITLLLLISLFFKVSDCFIILSQSNLYLSRCKNLNSFQRLTITQKMQKIHDVNSKIPIRRYSADSPQVRSMLNELKQRTNSCPDSENLPGVKVPRPKKSEPQDERIAKCTANYLLLSPRKVNKILRKIRKMPVLLAMGYLSQFGSHPYYLAIYKCIKSSLFNVFYKLNKASTDSLNNSNNNTNSNNTNNTNNTNNNTGITSNYITSNNFSDNTEFINNLLNNNLYNKEKLNIKFKMLYVTRGGYIKKPLFRAKGRCDIIRKPKSHINVVLSY